MVIDEIRSNRELYDFLVEFYKDNLEGFLENVLSVHKISIRINTIKADKFDVLKRLENYGFVLKQVPFYDDAFEVEKHPGEIGNRIEHFMGYYYVQSLSSLIPPTLLYPRPGDWVLDIAAAPGSKTTQMAQMMGNKGVIVANDVDVTRIKALSNNIDRMGVLNVIITLEQGHNFGKWYPNTFDKVLVDAPCSALGTLGKNPEVIKWWGRSKIGKLMAAQKSLILSGFDALKPGGLMVYSTCTVTPEENEYMVDYLLKSRENAEVLDFALAGVKMMSGITHCDRFQFSKDVSKCKRIEPYLNPGFEGFFIALIRKLPS